MPGRQSGEGAWSAVPGYTLEVILFNILLPPPLQPGASVPYAFDSCIIYLFLESHCMPKEKEPNASFLKEEYPLKSME